MNFPVFIPSRGRAGIAKAIPLCAGENLTVFVEPQEEQEYRAAYPGVNLYVLPEAGQGIVYVRQAMLDKAREIKASYYWQIDDNITGFFKLVPNPKNGRMKTAPCQFVEAAEYIENVVLTVKAPVGIGLAAMGLNNNMAAFATKAWDWNKLVYSAVLTRTDTNIDYMRGADCREDFEFCLHHLVNGWSTLLVKLYSMAKPITSGKANKGGLADAYKSGQSERASKLIHEKYPALTTLVPWHKTAATQIEGLLDIKCDFTQFSRRR